MKLLGFISTKDGELYERQIAKGARVSPASANIILSSFAEAGFVTRTKKGKMVFYSRNDGNPLLRQLKISMAVEALLPLVAKLKQFSRRIVLFGSCAEGRNGENSDIDLFIISSEKEKVRRLLEANPKVQAIVMGSNEYAQLEGRDRALYQRISSGIELWGGEIG